MNYLVAFVLKDEKTEELKDEYHVFLKIDYPDSKQKAKDFYDAIVENGLNGQEVYSANICEIIQSTDY